MYYYYYGSSPSNMGAPSRPPSFYGLPCISGEWHAFVACMFTRSTCYVHVLGVLCCVNLSLSVHLCVPSTLGQVWSHFYFFVIVLHTGTAVHPPLLARRGEHQVGVNR